MSYFLRSFALAIDAIRLPYDDLVGLWLLRSYLRNVELQLAYLLHEFIFLVKPNRLMAGRAFAVGWLRRLFL